MHTYYITVVYRESRWQARFFEDRGIFRHLRREARLPEDVPDLISLAYEQLLAAAGLHGIGLETYDADNIIS